MRCQGCGHDYPSTITRCTRCGQITPRRTPRPSGSRLIEFPRKARAPVENETNQSALPAWRLQVNEKVREVKAKRSGGEAAAAVAPAIEETPQQKDIDPGVAAKSSKQVDAYEATRNTLARDKPRAGADRSPVTQPIREPLPTAGPGGKSSDAIVEAALTRVRRASENASRASLPKIEPARPLQPSGKAHNEATARALEPSNEINVQSNLATTPLPTYNPAPEPERTDKDSFASDCVEPLSVGPIDEIEPLDYLEAEIKKVDQSLSGEFARNENASLFVHIVIGVTDLLAIALSCAPFLLLISFINGNFADRRTQLGAGLIVTLVTFFYLALTQSLSGKTFGMMLTNTRVVDAYTFEQPSVQKVLVRTVGYFIAVLPLMLGMLWLVFNRKRRGWHDFISGTLVARDF